MPRYIDADALNAAIEKWFDGACVYDVPPSEAVYDFQSIVDEQPTISPDEVRGVGKWIMSEVFKGYAMCSRCEDAYVDPEWISKDGKWNYCPSCGAKMEVSNDA